MINSWQPILDFWIGPLTSDAQWPEAAARRWFSKDQNLDEEIRQRFGQLVEDATAGSCAAWATGPRSLLALLILLDQFSRNIYRGTARAFAADPVARRYALEGINNGFDQQVRPVERLFYYLPLEHAEDLAIQERSVALFERLLGDAPTSLRSNIEGNLEYARRHRDIIARFGRFPHRNAVLGRKGRREEEEFLMQPGSSF